MSSGWIFNNLRPQHPPWSWIPPIFSLQTLTFAELSSILSMCGKHGNLRMGSSLHASVIKSPEFYNIGCNPRDVLVVWNSLLSMYTKCGKLYDAIKVFDHMPLKDTISWNSIMSGIMGNGKFEMAFGYFKEMRVKVGFDRASLSTILSSCDGFGFIEVNKLVHGLVILSGYEREISIANSLISAYCRCGCLNSGRQVFYEMEEKNVITWTALISGLLQNDFYEESLKVFAEMQYRLVTPNYLTYLITLSACAGLQALKLGCQIHGIVIKLGFQSDICTESALMDLYCKCGDLDNAWKVFESADVIDEVSMTVLLIGFSQSGFEDEAVQIFVKMVRSGSKIDASMVSAILGVFGTQTSLGLGKQVHSVSTKKGFGTNIFVTNGLINMYSKCGVVEECVKVFIEMPQRNQVSWNSMLAAYARHGYGLKALNLYEEMKSQGVEPTDVTFVSLLHACSHIGLVYKGMEFLHSMQSAYGISPRMEHYACVVDMLGRAGLLKEAKQFIEGLPVKPDALIWQALLGACGIHCDTEIGIYAADQLAIAAPDSFAPYILMANIYSSRGKWEDRARVIKKIKETRVEKEMGISWIEIDKKIHSFVVADQMHPRVDFIYRILLELFQHMRDEEYITDDLCLLYYNDQEETNQFSRPSGNHVL